MDAAIPDTMLGAADAGRDAAPADAPVLDAAPNVSPDAAPNASPDAAPNASPDAAPNVSPDAAPNVSPDAAPNVSPDAAPNVSPDAATPDFTISTSVSHVDLRVPKVTPVTVTVQRSGGFTGSVVVSATGLPPGVTANSITITSGSTRGTLQIDAQNGTGGDTATVTLVGTSGALMHTTSFSVFVLGATGSRDTAFGTNGATVLPSSPGAWTFKSLLVLPDGSIVATGIKSTSFGGPGTLLAVKLHPNGTLDTSFGGNGTGVATLNFSNFLLTKVNGGYGALQSDGKIIIVGQADSLNDSTGGADTVAIARLTDSGTLDPLAGGSEVAEGLGEAVDVRGVAVDSMDRILVAGDVQQSSSLVAMVARFGPNGAIDGSFGFATNLAGDEGRLPAIDGSDRIVMTDLGSDVGLLRFTSTGVPDTSFGGNGHVTFHTPGKALPLSGGALLVPDRLSGNIDRFAADGTIDPNFGSSGVTTVSQASSLGDIVLTAAGRPIACGNGPGGVVLVRLKDTTKGALDPTFGTNGVAVDGAGSSADLLAVHTKFRLVVLEGSGPYHVVQYWY